MVFNINILNMYLAFSAAENQRLLKRLTVLFYTPDISQCEMEAIRVIYVVYLLHITITS
jgi:hypothetical protein